LTTKRKEKKMEDLYNKKVAEVKHETKETLKALKGYKDLFAFVELYDAEHPELKMSCNSGRWNFTISINVSNFRDALPVLEALDSMGYECYSTVDYTYSNERRYLVGQNNVQLCANLVETYECYSTAEGAFKRIVKRIIQEMTEIKEYEFVWE
jgi:hypothetical protein